MQLLDLHSCATKKRIERFLAAEEHELSAFSFVNLFIWQDFFTFYAAMFNGALCIFAQDTAGTFMYLPPLGRSVSEKTINAAFDALEERNGHSAVSRIENIEDSQCDLYRRAGRALYKKSDEYVHSSSALVALKGNRYKSKRAACNHFVRHYPHTLRAYEPRHRSACIALYDVWQEQRRQSCEDPVYTAMLAQSRAAFVRLLGSADFVGVSGYIIEAGGEVVACTFGYPLTANTWCILFEIADARVKGSAQFIFREFCSRQKGYEHINVMDDSGLSNIARVKKSYHPERIIPSFCAQ